ncbi:MAG: DUF1211 domain-containing protein [Acidobacteria bacterium]|nr:MAG: DUF1211 domain-containing protein [Acidobacteriota bacterium]
MTKGRLEAFTDGVLAILITIMVLEMKAPHSGEAELQSLRPVVPAFMSYVLSFIYLGIYWNNHHHLFHAVQRVSGLTLWANLHLLFWLSLIPFVTSWMGETHFAAWPVSVYGAVLLMSAVAWDIERRVLLRHHPTDSPIARALAGRRARKEWTSLVLYAAGIGLALASPWLACALYTVVAAMWLIPDRRIEREIFASPPAAPPSTPAGTAEQRKGTVRAAQQEATEITEEGLVSLGSFLRCLRLRSTPEIVL